MIRSDHRADAAFHLSAIHEQKISLAKYSEITGVPLHQLRYWRKRELKAIRDEGPDSGPVFHSIPVSFGGTAVYTIHVGHHRLEIPRGFVPSEVQNLISILRNA